MYIADLEPVKGSEANKQRPVVIVSNDASNQVVEERGAGMVTVVPLTTQTERVYAFQVLVPAELVGLEYDSKAQAEQVRALSTNRLQANAIGILPAELMRQLDQALRLHLAL